MCDFSLQAVKSRSATIDDKLITTNFGYGTRGFAAADDPMVAVCLLPGTELAFEQPVNYQSTEPYTTHKTAIFRQINKDLQLTHHDALELPDGKQMLLTYLAEGQRAVILQLPAAPKTEAEAKEQERLPVVA